MVGIGPKFIIMLPVLIILLFAVIAALVLLVRVCIKKPWVAAIIVLLFLLAPIIILRPISHRKIVSYEPQADPLLPSVIQSGDTTAAIWSPGIEDEFKADMYPSKFSAVRSLGRQIAKNISYITEGGNSPEEIIVYRNSQDIELVEELRDVIAKLYPDINCKIELGNITNQDNKIGVYFYINNNAGPDSRLNSSRDKGTSGTIQANVLAKNRQQVSVKVDFIEKPWIEDFTSFINRQPHQQLIIARSSESCLSEAEANQQAMNDACIQVGPLLTNIRDPIKLSPNDILENGMIIDRFVQSFEGTAGKIWRQALLIDTSKEKLNQLVHRNVIIARARRFSIMRSFFSIAGLFILIIIVYAFLNAATKGYYTWSLRIAGFVLALILIFLLLV